MLVICSLFLSMACSKDSNSEVYEYNQNNLTGTYSLKFLESKEVKTVDVNGFDVITTTKSKGDTFDATFAFAPSNTVVKNGSYRIVETITQGDQTRENSYIVILDNEATAYSVQASVNKLTIDGITYDVKDFKPTGFRLERSETTIEANGDKREFTEEMRFEK